MSYFCFCFPLRSHIRLGLLKIDLREATSKIVGDFILLNITGNPFTLQAIA